MIVFQNKGLIDLRAIKTFGASSKDCDSPIGYFGTGLKYALAILLREGCVVKLYRGRTKYEFAAKTTRIRKDKFNLVTMSYRKDGKSVVEELGFTTELGKDWDLWQAFRELWCNTIDEGGVIARLDSKGEAGSTTITVEGEAFEKAFDERGDILLIDEPDLVLDGVEVRHRPSQYLYFRGIRVQKLRYPSVVTYNITRKIHLTEDRTAAYEWEVLNIVKGAVTRCTEIDFITEVITAADDTYENSFDFEDLSHDAGAVFTSTASGLKGDKQVNASAMRMVKEAKRKEMEVHDGEELTGEPKDQLDKAKGFLQKIGCGVDNYDLIIVDALPDDQVCLCEGKKIFITPDPFAEGIRKICEKLLDATMTTSRRSLIGKIISVGEQAVGITLDQLEKDDAPQWYSPHSEEGVYLVFELTMPSNNAWDGKWTGAGKYYAITRASTDPEKTRKLLEQDHWLYNFGDGWTAQVSIRCCSKEKAERVEEKSVGFCGYEWMVASILQHGEIRS